MHRLFDLIMKPILKEISFTHIVEIGCKEGKNTLKLLEICHEKKALLSIIDPYPTCDETYINKTYPNVSKLYKNLSLNILPQIEEFDVLLIDGDHNYYTVYHELKILEKKFRNKTFPLVFLHDVSWPYARRDLYYDPSSIPNEGLNPYEKKGIIYGKQALDENGLNRHLNNASFSDNPKNGVLTAIEDFMKETEHVLIFDHIDCFNGLGIMTSSEIVVNLFKTLKTSDEMIELLEKERNLLATDLENKIYKEKDILKNSEKQSVDEMILNQKLYIDEVQKLSDGFRRDLINQQMLVFNLQETYHQKLEDYHLKLKSVEDVYQSKIKVLEATKDKLTKENVTLNQQKNNLSQQLHQAKSDVSLHKDSATFKIGQKIVDLMAKPYKIFTLPFEIYQLYKEGKKRYGKSTKVKKMKVTSDLPLKIKKMSKKRMFELKKQKESLSLFHKLHLKYQQPSDAFVSIIVLNRNGSAYLKTLLSSIIKQTVHKRYEVLIVDNASTDDSIELIKNFQNKLELTLIRSNENLSFSKANNIASQKAKGEYLVFLNNDTEVTYGWLRELLGMYLINERVGLIGPKLVYPYSVNHLNFEKELKVQQAGILFNEEKDFIRPFNYPNGIDPYHDLVSRARKFSAITAACALISKVKFDEVNGFDEVYFYGYEDVDLGLKLIEKGYDNLYCPTSLIYHYEFGSQEKDTNDEKRNRRLCNMKHFKDKWFKNLTEEILKDKIDHTNFYTEKPLTFAFSVSNAGDNVKEGDYFTALELATALEKKGYQCKFLSRKSANWYDVGLDTDILITMIDAYDLGKIENAKDSLIKIAWARNWFDRWMSHLSYFEYDLVLASGVSACNYMKQNGIHDIHLFPIATNQERFNLNDINSHFEKCDYLFTGSYWNSPREIIDLLNPSQIPFDFKIYGHNWEKVEQLKEYNAGFVNYEEVPALYKSTKIVLDDANFVTKPFGSVNSRVFDALASGRLVITNGKLGSIELFNGELPYFSNQEELEAQVIYYLSNEEAYAEKVQTLFKLVLEHHTYEKRSDELIALIMKFVENKSMNIKIPVPKWEIANEWGDYHFALSLAKEFRKLETNVKITILPNWENDSDVWFNHVLLLRGLSIYEPKQYHFNMMWNISHPDQIPISEYQWYDVIFVASLKWAKMLETMVDVPVLPLLQCSDHERFNKPYQQLKHYQLLFVGNSRKIFRKILFDLLPTQYHLSVFGSKWEGIIDEAYIKGEYISNDVLGDEYARCEILLNDHWDDMREKGFISNRIFDAFLSSAFIISDAIEGIEDVFEDALITYKDKEDLNQLINYYLHNEDKRIEKINQGKAIVLKYHTFQERAKEILAYIKQYQKK